MDSTDALLETKKDEFKKKLLQFLLPEVKEHRLAYEDFQDICADIMNMSEEVDVEEQLFAVLYFLTQKWSVLKPMLEKEKITELHQQDSGQKEEKIDLIRNKLLSFSNN